METLTRAVADPDSFVPGQDELERLSFDVFALDTLIATLRRYGHAPDDVTIRAAARVRSDREARLRDLDRRVRRS